MWAPSQVLRGCQAVVGNRWLFPEDRACAPGLVTAAHTGQPRLGCERNTLSMSLEMCAGDREEGRDGDADLGIAQMVQGDTPGTDKITWKENLREACVFRAFTDDKDPGKRV